MSNVIIESDFQTTTAVGVITEDIKPPTQISKIIENTIMLAKTVRNIMFMYCNRFTNKLADSIASKANPCTFQTVILS